MNAPNPMVTFFKKIDVTNLVHISRKYKWKLNMVLIAAAMSLALCACGTEATGSMSITETGEQQTVKQNTGTEQADTEENSLKQDTEKTTSEISESQQTQTKKSSYLELDKVLDEINTEIKQGTAGSGSTSIKVAAHLLNWGVDKAVK